MNKQLHLVTLLCVVSWRCGVSAAVLCSPGERLHTPRYAQAGDECIPCGSGTFMPKRNHMLRECYNCSKIDNPQIETVITECSRTHDTEIGCISGYYRLKAKTVLDKDSCVECGKCESGFPVRPCQGYNDTVCCPLHQDAVLNSQGIIECWERPTCEAGMYYNTTLQRCMSCPNGTYMQARGHTNRACIKCEALSGNTSNHAAILHSCSRTSPTIFGCEEGHFRVSNKSSMLEEVPCRPCQKCRFEVKKCHSHQDAACAEDDYSSHGEKDAGQDVKETVPSNSTDVPESEQVKPNSRTSIFEISSMYLGEILEYVMLVSIYCLKRAYGRVEGQNVMAILQETGKLWREYYLYPLMVLLFFRAVFVLNYGGVFSVFTQYDIYTTLIMASIFTAALFSSYLVLPKALKAWLKARLNYVWCVSGGVCCGYVAAATTSAKTRAQKRFKWLLSGKDATNSKTVDQTVQFIVDPQNNPGTPPDETSQ